MLDVATPKLLQEFAPTKVGEHVGEGRFVPGKPFVAADADQ
jgi:hypothetical protein